MTQKSEQEGKLSLNRPGTLELKKTVETGQVRQSFSHGRSKSVMVEVKKKRSFGRDSAGRGVGFTVASSSMSSSNRSLSIGTAP